jgi:hypothetical protein
MQFRAEKKGRVFKKALPFYLAAQLPDGGLFRLAFSARRDYSLLIG